MQAGREYLRARAAPVITASALFVLGVICYLVNLITVGAILIIISVIVSVYLIAAYEIKSFKSRPKKR